LESEPMSIPRSLLSMIDVVMIQLRTEIEGKPARRALTVTEVVALDPKTKELLTNDVYRWDAKHDVFLYSGRSYILERNVKKLGVDSKEIEEELHRRKTVLEWMVRKKIRRYTDVATVIREYSANPIHIYRKARMEAH